MISGVSGAITSGLVDTFILFGLFIVGGFAIKLIINIFGTKHKEEK